MNPEQRIQREAMLRQAVLAGDEQAWRTWYLETFDQLDRYVLWRCGGRRDVADDIVQETWLTAVKQIRRFAPQQGSFLAWLRGIAVNVRRNQARREKRLSARQATWNNQRDPANAAASMAEEQHRSQQIASTLDALPQRQEAVLRAKYSDGLSVAEIAVLWNETPKAVESLLTRAREAFREQFEKLANQPE